MRALCSGWRELHRCSRDRKRRRPDCLVLDPGRSQQEVRQQQPRINRSIAFQFMRNHILMNADTRTHEKQYPISIFLPALNHLVVFNVCSGVIYREERRSAVSGIGVSLRLRWLIQWRPRMVAVVIHYKCQWNEQEKIKVNTYGVVPPRCLGGQFETLMRCRSCLSGIRTARVHTWRKRHVPERRRLPLFICCHVVSDAKTY